MLVRIGNWLLIVTLLVTTGGQWALLQSFAWATMLADHLQAQSLAESVKQTFDGQHPCKLCCALRAAKKAEKKAECPGAAKKVEFPPFAARLVVFGPAAFQLLNSTDTFAESSLPQPPVPPPRTLPV